MRMKLKQSGNHINLTYLEPMTGEIEHREFYVPFSGGYVREGNKQVCKNLSHYGYTLEATVETLANVIRREYKGLMRIEKKWLNPA